jgi:hypothetical protein
VPPTSTSRVTIPLRPPQAVAAVAAQWWVPDEAITDTIVVLAHGAGSRLDHPLHTNTCAAVAAAGCRTLGFNFGYAEAGRKGPDPMPRLLRAYSDVLEWVRDAHPGAPIAIGGRSMGGRTASLLAAEGTVCAGLVLLNYPLLPANRQGAGEPRVAHWPQLRGPVLFVHGTRDRLFDESVFAAHRHLLDDAAVTVHTIPAADHGFAVPKAAGRTATEVFAEVGQTVARWAATLQQEVAR